MSEGTRIGVRKVKGLVVRIGVTDLFGSGKRTITGVGRTGRERPLEPVTLFPLTEQPLSFSGTSLVGDLVAFNWRRGVVMLVVTSIVCSDGNTVVSLMRMVGDTGEVSFSPLVPV